MKEALTEDDGRVAISLVSAVRRMDTVVAVSSTALFMLGAISAGCKGLSGQIPSSYGTLVTVFTYFVIFAFGSNICRFFLPSDALPQACTGSLSDAMHKMGNLFGYMAIAEDSVSFLDLPKVMAFTIAESVGQVKEFQDAMNWD